MRASPAAIAAIWLLLTSQCVQRGDGQPLVLGPTSAALAVPEGARANYSNLNPNPEVGPDLSTFRVWGPVNAVGVHTLHVPGTDDVVLIERPNNGHPIRPYGYTTYEHGVVLNAASHAWEPVDTDEAVYDSGHAPSPNGTLILAGGAGRHVVGPGSNQTVYAPGVDGIHVVSVEAATIARIADLTTPRRLPTLTLLPDTRILISGGATGIGGGSPNVGTHELFDPSNPANGTASFPIEPTWLSARSPNYTPFTWVLPTGHVFQYGDAGSRIFIAQTGEYIRETLPGGGQQYVTSPPRPGGYASRFPFTGSAVMAALEPDEANSVSSATFIVFGGAQSFSLAGDAAVRNRLKPAARVSHRITLSWTRTDPGSPWRYTFSNWTAEDMGYPRVMPDATLLPNGDVVILNGGQTGVAGTPRSNVSLSPYPAFWATLYQVDGQEQERYTLLAGSYIPRMIHSTAVLTVNGTVLVAGSDRGHFLDSEVPFMTAIPRITEYRWEIFEPPHYNDWANKPAIVSLDGVVGSTAPILLAYGSPHSIQFTQDARATVAVTVTSVVLVAPSATTNSWNSNQRVVRLRVLSVSAAEVQVLAPANPFIAPPQLYMLFILNGKTYSAAHWVSLQDPAGLGKAIPSL